MITSSVHRVRNWLLHKRFPQTLFLFLAIFLKTLNSSPTSFKIGSQADLAYPFSQASRGQCFIPTSFSIKKLWLWHEKEMLQARW